MKAEDFFELLNTFRKSALHFEARSRYVVEGEEKIILEYKNGRPLPPGLGEDGSGMQDWLNLISGATRAGKEMRRIRVVELPPSPYVRYEFEWAYPFSADAGQEIFVVEILQGAERPAYAADDFWLFDDDTVVVLEYDEEDKWIGPRLIDDPERIRHYRQVWRDALADATAYPEYLASLRSRGGFFLDTTRT